jgi:hypothetical protein
MHIDGGLEVARAVKNMSSLKVLDLNGEHCFFYSGLNSKIYHRQLLWSGWNRRNS